MATSGTFTGSRGGNSYGPWLELYWERRQVDIPNNRSLIRLTLRLHSSSNIHFTASKTGSLHGSSFTYTGGMTSTGSRVLRTRDVWVNHNSDGSKTQRFSASFNIAIRWGGSHLSSLSVSGDANITAIPRASTLSAFSFNAHLKNGTANRINYTVDRKSSSFRHHIQLRDGSTVLRTWDNVSSNGSSTLTLTASEVNTLLKRMSSSTTRSFTLRVRTRSGSGGSWIGSAVTRNATATVHADVKPSVGSVSVSQTGNSVSSHTLQGFSKIKASFSRSAGYGASISNSSITVRRKSGGADSQTINSNSGTTSRAVSLSGTYQARGMARDSRGRTTYTSWVEFTVTAYSAPRITSFTATRSSSTPTTVNISRAGTHTPLGGSNPLTYTVQRRIGTGAWTNVNTRATGTSTSSSFSGTSISTGNSVTSSYDFRMVITDKFGERAESIITVSTQRVVLDIHKNEGVGIGKIHERGVLDVDGEAYVRGTLTSEVETSGSALRIQSDLPNGHGYLGYWGSDNIRKAYAGFGSTGSNTYTINNESGGHINFISDGHVQVNSQAIVHSGSNSNGNWIRFYDGIQICWAERVDAATTIATAVGNVYRTHNTTWDFPMRFIARPSVSIQNNFSSAFSWGGLGNQGVSNDRIGFAVFAPQSSNARPAVGLIAIGRWK